MASIGSYTNLGLHRADQLGTVNRHSSAPGDGAFSDLREDVDGTPATVALIGLGALALMFGLKYLGFRFSFGVSAGR